MKTIKLICLFVAFGIATGNLSFADDTSAPAPSASISASASPTGNPPAAPPGKPAKVSPASITPPVTTSHRIPAVPSIGGPAILTGKNSVAVITGTGAKHKP